MQGQLAAEESRIKASLSVVQTKIETVVDAVETGKPLCSLEKRLKKLEREDESDSVFLSRTIAPSKDTPPRRASPGQGEALRGTRATFAITSIHGRATTAPGDESYRSENPNPEHTSTDSAATAALRILIHTAADGNGGPLSFCAPLCRTWRKILVTILYSVMNEMIFICPPHEHVRGSTS